MKTKHILIAFAITAIAQLVVPLKMVYDSAMIERHGTVYKFRTKPIDPSDPFKGKYITLKYDVAEIPSNDTTWVYGSDVYVSVVKDKRGFGRAISASVKAPKSGDYFKAQVRSHIDSTLFVDIPFDRFYMEESKAYEAEAAYREYSENNDKPAYALVALKEGNAVVKDVIIDNMLVRDYVVRERKNKPPVAPNE